MNTPQKKTKPFNYDPAPKFVPQREPNQVRKKLVFQDENDASTPPKREIYTTPWELHGRSTRF